MNVLHCNLIKLYHLNYQSYCIQVLRQWRLKGYFWKYTIAVYAQQKLLRKGNALYKIHCTYFHNVSFLSCYPFNPHWMYQVETSVQNYRCYIFSGQYYIIINCCVNHSPSCSTYSCTWYQALHSSPQDLWWPSTALQTLSSECKIKKPAILSNILYNKY